MKYNFLQLIYQSQYKQLSRTRNKDIERLSSQACIDGEKARSILLDAIFATPEL
jgi:hypothetical protein